MSKQQAVKSILENLQLVDEVDKFISNEFSITLFKAVDKVIKDEFEGWIGTFDFWEKFTNFSSENWVLDHSEKTLGYKNCIAQYNLGQIGEVNQYWISNLFNVNSNLMAFVFQGNWGNDAFNFDKRKWKKFSIEMNEKYPELQKLGFKFDAAEGLWRLPIKPLDIQTVIECYEKDLEEAMEPIRESCSILLKAHPYFEKIMEEARNYDNN